MARFRGRPSEIEALHWTGTNSRQAEAFTGPDVFSWSPLGAWLWNTAKSMYAPLHQGDWIVQGAEGEFYPLSDEALHARYEPADSAPGPGYSQVTALIAGDLSPDAARYRPGTWD